MFLCRRRRRSHPVLPSAHVSPTDAPLSLERALAILDQRYDAETESSRVRSSEGHPTSVGARKGRWAKGTGFGGSWCCPELDDLYNFFSRRRATQNQRMYDEAVENAARALDRILRAEENDEALLERLRASKLKSLLRRRARNASIARLKALKKLGHARRPSLAGT